MKVEISLSGMSCGHCVKAVTAALSGLPGVSGLHVEVGRASFEAASQPDEAVLRAAIDDAGFEVAAIRVMP